MTNPAVSVVVVSRGRPKLLQICLLAISQLNYEDFEIIVVADQDGLEAVRSAGFFDRIKTALCEIPNISIARNIAVEMSAGDVVAFIDDDSVPEPSWLFYLAAVFNNPSIEAAGGYVRGRNGISFQSEGETVNIFGGTEPLGITGDEPTVMPTSDTVAIKTVGTNCAFRRTVFEQLGGFDPAFSYYLDESDMNQRIAKSGRTTAVVPLAQVHHKTAASPLRKANRLPIGLEQVGSSIAVFLTKHCPPDQIAKTLEDTVKDHRHRLVQHMMKGRCRRRDVERLLGTMKCGIKIGLSEGLSRVPSIDAPNRTFLRFVNPQETRQHVQISGYRTQSARLRKRALDAVNGGAIVSLFVFSRTAFFHRVSFHPDGYWEQFGGLFGRSVRSEPLFHWYTMNSRSAKEIGRLKQVRFPWQN